ncbi:MAG: autotransporter domain-containing protein [Myxococcota bacterium]|nr:autotransporter domain-containing protein [Myxococcota bacterium]
MARARMYWWAIVLGLSLMSCREVLADEILEIDRSVFIFNTSGTSQAPQPEIPGSIFAAIDDANDLSQISNVDYINMTVEQSLINLSIVLEDQLPAIDLDTSTNPDARVDLQGVPAFFLTTAEDVAEDFTLLRVKQGRADLVDIDIQSGRLNDDGDPVALSVQVDAGAKLGFRYADDFTFDENITGDGSIIIETETVVTFSGTNDYTGGTTVSQGTLRGNSLSIQGDFDLAEETRLEFDVEGASTLRTFAGNIQGDGRLIKVGNGELNLSGGVASQNGGTQIALGTLQATSSSLLGDVIVEQGANFKISASGAPAFSGDISGAGSVTKIGSNPLTFDGTNSFTGGLTIEEGELRSSTLGIPGNVTLQLASGAAATPTLTFDQNTDGTHTGTIEGSGGILQKDGSGRVLLLGSTAVSQTQIIAGTLAGTPAALGNNLTISSGATAEFAVDTDQTFSGALAGTGGLSKTGTGRLILQGSANHSGTTTIAGGELQLDVDLSNSSEVQVNSDTRLVNGGGRIGGDLRVKGDGRIATGDTNSVFNVTGSATLESNSILEVAIDSIGSASLLEIAGTANLQSPRYELDLSAGDYSNGVTATILTAADIEGGDIQSGQVIADLAFITAKVLPLCPPPLPPSCNPTSLRVNLEEAFDTLPSLAETPNQEATAVALEQLVTSVPVSPDTQEIKDALSPLRKSQVPLVLDMMAGETLTAFTNLRLNNARLFGNMISRRLSASNWELERSPARAPLDIKRPQDRNPPRARGGPGVWIEPFGIFGNNQGDGQATEIDSQSYGLSGGLDYRVPQRTPEGHAQRWRFGLALGYTRQTLKNGIGYMSGEGNTVQTSLYAGYRAPRFHIGAAGRFAWSGLSTQRRIDFTTLSREARAQFDGLEWGGLVDLGGHFGNRRSLRVHPFARFQYIRTNQNAIQESGAGNLSLSAPSEAVNSFLLTLGGRLSTVFTLGGQFGIEPEIRLAWTADYGNRDRPITTTFFNSPGAVPFTTYGAPANDNAAAIGIGYVMRLGDVPLLSTHYDALVGSQETTHMISAGILFRW